MTGTFDPATFLQGGTDQPMDTSFEPVGEGEYSAVIDKLDVRQFQGTKDPSKTYTSLDVTWRVDSPEEQVRLGRDTLTVRQSLFLDMNATGLDVGKGKNVQLGRLREAVGLNKPGVPFAFNDLIGQAAKVAVAHRVVEGRGDIFAEVKAVAPLS